MVPVLILAANVPSGPAPGQLRHLLVHTINVIEALRTIITGKKFAAIFSLFHSVVYHTTWHDWLISRLTTNHTSFRAGTVLSTAAVRFLPLVGSPATDRGEGAIFCALSFFRDISRNHRQMFSILLTINLTHSDKRKTS